MEKEMKDKIKKIIKNRNLTIIIVGIVLIIISFNIYKGNKSKVFMDEYMEDIFVEEDIKVSQVGNTDIFLEEPKKIIYVEIKGEVKMPDVYKVEEGSIIKDIIDKAGGLTEKANIEKINRAKKLTDNELIIIPNNDNVNEVSGSNFINTTEEKSGKININTADLSKLKEIPGVGDVKAKSIIEYREKSGGFKSIEDIKNIDGIGEKTFEKIKDSISI
ncbi:helix-hairpin-helix domain-containing protein [Clostridium sp.]|uniref:helix-hairpin-helix domain-containing protein n=1 Tax=Clostridium sp. TaxID=1506 RepID=UPI00260A44E3|nr:helix-hairpin-helix domain-containing protein [Clostridium sp.]